MVATLKWPVHLKSYHWSDRFMMNFSLPECDISVSKLLGVETVQFFWMVSDSVSKKFGIKKSIGFGIGNIWYRKSIGFSIEKT